MPVIIPDDVVTTITFRSCHGSMLEVPMHCVLTSLWQARAMESDLTTLPVVRLELGSGGYSQDVTPMRVTVKTSIMLRSRALALGKPPCWRAKGAAPRMWFSPRWGLHPDAVPMRVVWDAGAYVWRWPEDF